jgi:hypothetical protein
MKLSAKIVRGITGFVGALAISTALVAPTFAAPAVDTVSQQITSGGSLSASVANATMSSVSYSNTAGSSTGTLDLSVSDPRGTSLGWNVTIQSTDFVRTGSLLTNTNAHDIPVSGFTIVSLGTPVATAGQAVDATGGPKVGSVTGLDLSAPRKTISANAGFGSGNYTESIPVSLVIPAMSQTGTYVATLTVTISSAP